MAPALLLALFTENPRRGLSGSCYRCVLLRPVGFVGVLQRTDLGVNPHDDGVQRDLQIIRFFRGTQALRECAGLVEVQSYLLQGVQSFVLLPHLGPPFYSSWASRLSPTCLRTVTIPTHPALKAHEKAGLSIRTLALVYRIAAKRSSREPSIAPVAYPYRTGAIGNC